MKKILIVVVAVIVAAIVWHAFVGGEATENLPPRDVSVRRRISAVGEKSLAREKIDAAAAAITNGTRRAVRRLRVATDRDAEALWTFEDGRPWPEGQKRLMRKIMKAAEADDYQSVASFAADVAKCPNAELREKYVEELGWFGEQAFVDLSSFIADPNEDVADAARTQMVDSFQEIDDDAEKAALFGILARAVTDSELLDSLSDELFVMDEVLALQTIADTISDGTEKARKKAMEIYETITDEKWTDIEAAETWLCENYTDSDDSAAGDSTNEADARGNGDSSDEEQGAEIGADDGYATGGEVR